MWRNLHGNWVNIRRYGAVKIISTITVVWAVGWGVPFTLFIHIIDSEAISKKFFLHLSFISIFGGFLLGTYIWIRHEQRFRHVQKEITRLRKSNESYETAEKRLSDSELKHERVDIEHVNLLCEGQKPFQIVYHGPAVAGKTVNMQYLHRHMLCETKGELRYAVCPPDDHRHLSFPMKLSAPIAHENFYVYLQCIPGCMLDETDRENMIRHADAIVFIVDSLRERIAANENMLSIMEHILQQRGSSLQEFPWILQYNKRDLPNIASVQELQQCLNHANVPYVEAVASQGVGAIESFQEIVQRLSRSENVLLA